ncbi:MAG: SCP2 sterol-binding domain-containing protein [Actinomycetia bacterium]|nr:SCP2 sterol-binding domain-containing protein [Actinomycetes bacterium]MCP4960281.1 SCP2 sterol-binding domain-containing protein [Actinomycetes bacterium]
MKYLSTDWIDAVRDAVASDEQLAAVAAETELILQQVVTDTPFGEVGYFITFDLGRVYVQAGVASTSDVAFTQDYETAIAVHEGRSSALEAFQTGRISIEGEIIKLRDNRAAIAELDRSFTRVNETIEY